MIRIEAAFKGITADDMFVYFSDPPQMKNMFKEVKILDKFPDGSFIRYWRLKFPMMSERDNIMLIQKMQLPNGGMFINLKTVEHPEDPKYKDVIRMMHFL